MASFHLHTAYIDADKVVPFSVKGTPFEEVFDAADFTNNSWWDKMNRLMKEGARPKYTLNTSNEACVRAWLDIIISKRLNENPNITFVKMALGAGINEKQKMIALWENSHEWYDGASFRGALGDVLGVHDTQLHTLQMAQQRDDPATMALGVAFFELPTAFKWLEKIEPEALNEIRTVLQNSN